MRPRKNLEREINGRRIERVHGVFQINSKRVTRIKVPRLDNQGVGKIINLPVAFLVGIGQTAARDVTANAEMVKFGLVRAQANFDVTQALAEGQLREGHAQILIQMGERFCGVVRRVTRDAATKCVQRKKIHQLRENKFADVHGNHQGRKAPVSQIQVQVGNTQKVLFPILYQSLAPRHQQNCRTAVAKHF